MTFGDYICEKAETANTYMTGELNWAIKRSEIVLRLLEEAGWWTIENCR